MNENRRVSLASIAAGFIGLVLGIIYAGPHMHEWPLWAVVLAPLAGGTLGAVFGVVFGIMATGKRAAISSVGDGPDPMGPYAGLGDSRGAYDHSSTDHDGGHE